MVAIAYTSKLNEIFDRIRIHGVAEIPRAELLLWHNSQQRITKKLWRGLNEAWEKRCTDEWEYDEQSIPQIHKAFVPETLTYVIIWAGKKDENGEFRPWFRPLSEESENEDV